MKFEEALKNLRSNPNCSGIRLVDWKEQKFIYLKNNKFKTLNQDEEIDFIPSPESTISGKWELVKTLIDFL